MPCAKGVLTPSEAASRLDHDLETARAYYYRIWLDSCNQTVEYTVGRHSGILRINCGDSNENYFLVFAPESCDFCFSGRRLIVKGSYQLAPAWGVYEFSEEVSFEAVNGTHGIRGAGKAYSVFVGKYNAKSMEIRFAVSLIDAEQAQYNLEREVVGVTFDALKESAACVWNALIYNIQITGGTEYLQKTFYTAVYRVFLRQVCFSNTAGITAGMIKKVHNDDGREFCSNDGVWDHAPRRAPLQQLLSPTCTQIYLRALSAPMNRAAGCTISALRRRQSLHARLPYDGAGLPMRRARAGL